jgi:hypothetical protein
LDRERQVKETEREELDVGSREERKRGDFPWSALERERQARQIERESDSAEGAEKRETRRREQRRKKEREIFL